jgi:hypothetical protein
MRHFHYDAAILVYTLIAGYMIFADPMIDRAIAKGMFFLAFPLILSLYCRPKKEIE